MGRDARTRRRCDNGLPGLPFDSAGGEVLRWLRSPPERTGRYLDPTVAARILRQRPSRGDLGAAGQQRAVPPDRRRNPQAIPHRADHGPDRRGVVVGGPDQWATRSDGDPRLAVAVPHLRLGDRCVPGYPGAHPGHRDAAGRRSRRRGVADDREGDRRLLRDYDRVRSAPTRRRTEHRIPDLARRRSSHAGAGPDHPTVQGPGPRVAGRFRRRRLRCAVVLDSRDDNHPCPPIRRGTPGGSGRGQAARGLDHLRDRQRGRDYRGRRRCRHAAVVQGPGGTRSAPASRRPGSLRGAGRGLLSGGVVRRCPGSATIRRYGGQAIGGCPGADRGEVRRADRPAARGA